MIDHHIRNIYATTKHGWDRFGWLFQILIGGGIFGALFGFVGAGAIGFTLLFFYGMGRTHKALNGNGETT